jgi:hypothetical protein
MPNYIKIRGSFRKYAKPPGLKITNRCKVLYLINLVLEIKINKNIRINIWAIMVIVSRYWRFLLGKFLSK